MRTALLTRLTVPFCPAVDCTARQFAVVVACITCKLQWPVSLHVLSTAECCGSLFDEINVAGERDRFTRTMVHNLAQG